MLQYLPRLAYLSLNRPVVGSATLFCQKSQKMQYYVRVSTKLAKVRQYLL